MSYKTPAPNQEVTLALQDFFADKKDKAFRQASAPSATKLAWSLKKLVGEARSEDLDAIFAENPTSVAFNAFAERLVALEKSIPAAKKPLVDVSQITSVTELKQLEQTLKQAPSVDR